MGMSVLSPIDTKRVWTAAEVRALQASLPPDDWTRYELIDGELIVTSSPSVQHQRALKLLAFALDPYVRAEALGELLWSPADLEIETGHITQPDLFVIPGDVRMPISAWEEVRRLLVATEVLSPSTARYDRRTKRGYYLRNGTPEYWVVDLDARVIERWRPSDLSHPEVVDATLVWHPDGAAAPFTLDLPAYFAEVHGEPPTAATA